MLVLSPVVVVCIIILTGEIRFDEDAFHKLVMEERKKRLIYSLVTNSEKTFTDVISGKGGGW